MKLVLAYVVVVAFILYCIGLLLFEDHGNNIAMVVGTVASVGALIWAISKIEDRHKK
jgi:hypothetical protein